MPGFSGIYSIDEYNILMYNKSNQSDVDKRSLR
nr:MAG TPA: hypothetical protein [Caudoviricetes sp.]